ncbi:MAG TPA: hypothetical protein VGI81_18380 [Tepidisphaeraceae bacterium]
MSRRGPVSRTSRAAIIRTADSALVTVTNWLLPNSAQASAWQATLQLTMLTCCESLKWNPSLFMLTRLWMRMPSMRTKRHQRMRQQW